MIISTGAGKASVKIQQFFVTKTLNKLGKENFLYLTKGFGNGTPLQSSCLENPMDGGAWWAAVHGVTQSRMRLSDFTFTFHFHTLEKEMAPHSSVLAWRIPGTGEPGGLPSMGSHRVGHDWSDAAAAAQLTPHSMVKGGKLPPKIRNQTRTSFFHCYSRLYWI